MALHEILCKKDMGEDHVALRPSDRAIEQVFLFGTLFLFPFEFYLFDGFGSSFFFLFLKFLEESHLVFIS